MWKLAWCVVLLTVPSSVAQLSSSCQTDFTTFLNGVTGLEGWAWKMYDAWGNPESGQFSGNIVFEGRARQCNEVDAGFTGADGKPFMGRMCSTGWPYITGGIAGFGICVPSSCGDDDVYDLMQYVPPNRLPGAYPTEKNETINFCEMDDGIILEDPSAIGAISVICVFVALAVSGTLYDAITHKKRTKPRNIGSENKNNNANAKVGNSQQHGPVLVSVITGRENGEIHDRTHKLEETPETGDVTMTTSTPRQEPYKPNTCEGLLLAFSVYQNAPRMLSFDHARGSYQCLNGIRFLSMAWIVLGHTWQLGITLTGSPTVENTVDLYFEMMERASNQLIDYSNLAVECFFLLSALLTTISLLKQFKRSTNKKSRCTLLGLYYFHRFWRLTPVYMLLLMMWTVLFPYLRTGSLWPPNASGAANCQENWWKHLIYLNNLIDIRPETECMGWTWYLANDFQFYVIAPAFIALLFWVPIAGFVMTSLAIAGCIISTAYLQHGVYIRGDTFWYFDIYIKPWTRCGTYFIGIFLGYLMYRTNCKIRMHKVGVAVAWIVALAAITISVFMTWDDTKPGNKPWPNAANVAFETLLRPLFSMGIFWIILACCTGYGGVINWILSWRGWLPLARLTYTGYLIHPMIIYYTYYSSPAQIIVTDWIMMYYFLGTLLFSMGISFVVSLLLEVPFLAVEKVMLKNVKK